MTISVPKVYFLVPDDEEDEAEWIDLYHRLHWQRILFLSEEMTPKVVHRLITLMAYLGMEDETQELYLFINSPGGLARRGIALYYTMRNIRPLVNTICFGLSVSMASVILAAGEITTRLAYPHAKVMIRQPWAKEFKVAISEGVMDLEQLKKIRDTILSLYARRTGKMVELIHKDTLMQELFMSAEEAQAYGIVDLVAVVK